MKVAFATTDGNHTDEHFGRAGQFAIYEVDKEGFRFVEMRVFAVGVDEKIQESRGKGAEHDDLVEAKVDTLSDCKIIYVTEIGGPSAARLARRGIMPVKVKNADSIAEHLGKLVETIKSKAIPWLEKSI